MDNQPTQSTPLPPSSNSPSKTFLLVAGAIVLMAVSAVGGYYLGTNKEQKDSQPSMTENIEQITPSLPKISPTPTQKDWLIYADLNKGFSLKYPNTWNQYLLKNFADEVGTPIVALTPLSPKDSDKIYSLSGIEINPSNSKNCSNSTNYIIENLKYYQDQFIKDPGFRTAYPEFKVEPLKIEGIDGFIVTGLPGPGGREGLPTAYIFHCPTIVTILFDGSGIENGKQLFMQILSTVQLWVSTRIYPG